MDQLSLRVEELERKSWEGRDRLEEWLDGTDLASRGVRGRTEAEHHNSKKVEDQGSMRAEEGTREEENR